MINRIIAILAVLMFGMLGSNLSAQELSRFVAARVQQAYEFQSNDQSVKAIKVLESVDSSRAFDTSYVQRMLGILYWQQQQNSKAETALTRAIQSKGLPIEQHLETQIMLADIQLSNAKVPEALANYHQVIVQNKQKPSLDAASVQKVWLRIAQANYQLENWKPVLTAVQNFYAQAGKADTSVLRLQLAAELSLKRWSRALETTFALRAIEPKREKWWTQAVNLQLRTRNYPQALATLKQFERAGFELTSSQYRMMAQLYAKQGVPESSAQIFHQLNNSKPVSANDLAIEAKYWQLAREWDDALQAWARAASIDSDYRWPYIQLLMQNKHYQQAIAQLELLQSSARKELTTAQVYYRLGDGKKALLHAQKANQIHSDEATLSWIRFLDSKYH
ncbi:tetratricopeptide repeat protein [Vibrio gallicus]|uniref:tetratricopeptide repeat protein n=1 Tax=Vibrio gallicus TaxID=190897 RepID=UPI0021C2C2DB|nr:hypothetical protein [Vibrio gallicus]